MLITDKRLHFTTDETSQLAFLLGTNEDHIKALRHTPTVLLERIETLLKDNAVLDTPIKLFRAYFLPLWKKRLSIYKE